MSEPLIRTENQWGVRLAVALGRYAGWLGAYTAHSFTLAPLRKRKAFVL